MSITELGVPAVYLLGAAWAFKRQLRRNVNGQPKWLDDTMSDKIAWLIMPAVPFALLWFVTVPVRALFVWLTQSDLMVSDSVKLAESEKKLKEAEAIIREFDRRHGGNNG